MSYTVLWVISICLLKYYTNSSMNSIQDFWTLQAVAGVVVVYLITVGVYRLYLHPLAKFPGPRLAGLTRWYEGYYDVILGGQYTFKIAEMHKQYGKHGDEKKMKRPWLIHDG